jgi:GNAT superfamily N-acetyltransferase
MISYEWRGHFENAEVNALHAAGFAHRLLGDDWRAQVSGHSLGWACARDGRELVGFVNVPWDGGVHAFILDTLVAARAQHHGVGTRLVAPRRPHRPAVTGSLLAGRRYRLRWTRNARSRSAISAAGRRPTRRPTRSTATDRTCSA